MIEPADGAGAGVFRGRKTLSVMPTFTCPAACESCGTLSTPKERTRLDARFIVEAIREAKALGFYNVVFTGGEATLRWRELLGWIGLAKGLGFPVRLVTNAHWARSLDEARRCVGALCEAGLTEINYSTGDEHARFIPLEHVAFAVRAALERALPVTVVLELKRSRGVEKEAILGHPALAGLALDAEHGFKLIESPWMPISATVREEYPAGVAADGENVRMRTGCEGLLQSYTLQADGRIGACCGLGLREIDELNVISVATGGTLAQAIEEAENDFLKLWIHYKGPEKILAWAARFDPEIDWEGMYAHHCQACHRIYKDPRVAAVIREHYEEVIADVMQSAFLDEVAIPQAVAAV